MNAFAGKMFAGNCSELGRDPQARPATDGLLVIKPHPRRNAHSTTANPEIDRLIKRVITSLREMFIEHITARHTKISRAILNIGRHVSGSNNDQAQSWITSWNDEFARTVSVRSHLDPRSRQQGNRVSKNAALGKRKGEHRTLKIRQVVQSEPPAPSVFVPCARTRDRGGTHGQSSFHLVPRALQSQALQRHANQSP